MVGLVDLRERVTIETPEHVEFSYELAGLGSRFAAGLIDSFIQGSVILALFIAFWAGGTNISVMTYVQAALQGLMLIALFLLIWGYHLYFEVFRGGQSPGKKWLGIRVVAGGGHPCSLPRAAVRNLMRVVDFMPLLYAVGGVIMFMDRRGRRLGDLAAGTIVVRERGLVVPQAILAARVPEIGFRERGELLLAEERRVLRAFLRRRDDLANDARDRLAADVAGRIAERLRLEVGEDPEAFLEALERQGSVAGVA